jgi:hypothetical protein
MINKINKERRRSKNAAPTRSSNKSQWQGAQEDPKQPDLDDVVFVCLFLSFLSFFNQDPL